MSAIIRIVVTLILVLVWAVTPVLIPTQQAVLWGVTAAVVILLIPTWVVGNTMVKQSLQSAKNPTRIDREAKLLVEAIMENFPEDDRDKIGSNAQETIVSTMRKMKSGKIKGAGAAAKGMPALHKRQFKTARNKKEISATLAKFYVLAGDKTDDGERARMRINNFIAGIKDKTLDSKPSKA